MKTIIIYILLFWNLSFTLVAQSRFQAGDIVNVISFSGLDLREKPNLQAIITTSIPYGSSLSVVKDTTKVVAFLYDKLNSYFLYVNYNGKKGYVLDAYLTKLPAPILNGYEVEKYVQDKFKKIEQAITQTIPAQKDQAEITIVSQKLNYGTTFIKKDTDNSKKSSLRIDNMDYQEALVLVKAINSIYEPVYLNISFNHKGNNEWQVYIPIEGSTQLPYEFELTMKKNNKEEIEYYEILYQHSLGYCSVRLVKKNQSMEILFSSYEN